MSESDDKRSDRILHPESEATTGLYLGVYALLLLLLGLSIVLSFVELGPFAPVVALGIAGLKTYLIILFFMHVYYSSRLTKFVSGAAFIHLTILFGLMLADYVSRTTYVWGS